MEHLKWICDQLCTVFSKNKIGNVTAKNSLKESLSSILCFIIEVASPSAKNGGVLVTVYSSHVGCVCGRNRHDSICKYSIAVAARARQSILSTHFQFPQKEIKQRRPQERRGQETKTLTGQRGKVAVEWERVIKQARLSLKSITMKTSLF